MIGDVAHGRHPIRDIHGVCVSFPPPFPFLSYKVSEKATADMEELSAVGEQVFDAECILNKRLRKVRLHMFGRHNTILVHKMRTHY